MALTTVKSDQIQTSVALAGSPTTTTQSASDNSTKIATTAYADTAVANLVASAPAALNTLDELAAALNDDASFSTTITNSIATKLPLAGGTLTGDLILGDNVKLEVGSASGGDLQIYHNGSHSYIDDAGTGNLYIRNGSKNSIFARTDGEIILYYNNSGKLATNSGGVTVTGTAILGGATFVDNATAYFGTGLDLRIYHDGSNSYIKNNTGWLNMPMGGSGVSIANSDFSESIAKFLVNGACELYHNGSKKIETTSTGITVTGSVTSGAHLINASSSAFGGSSVQGFNTDFVVDTGQGYSRHNSYHTGGSNHQFLVNEAGSTTNAIALSIAKDKTVTFGGDLAIMTDGAEFKLYYTQPRKFISNSGASVTIKQIDNDATNAYIDFAAWDNSSLMRLMNSGNLLVNGATSNAKLSVKGAASLRAQNVQVAVDGHTAIGFFNASGTDVGGIAINASGASISLGGNAAANTLDQYKSLTAWTPVLYKGSSPVSSYNTQTGHYLRVGGLLFFSFYLYKQWDGTGKAGSAGWRIYGLPFNITSTTSASYQIIPVGYFTMNGSNIFNSSPHRWQGNSTSYMEMYGTHSTSAWSSGIIEFAGSGCISIY